MQYPGYNSGKVILSEGKWFPFRIHNLIQLQDDAWYYVLEDVNGLKHFLPAEHYEKYGFNIGAEITCKIDRINCTGRIFLEPKHPFYKEGEIYSFEVISYHKKSDDGILIIKDILENCIEVPVCGNENREQISKKRVSCIIKSIIKGNLILEIIHNNS